MVMELASVQGVHVYMQMPYTHAHADVEVKGQLWVPFLRY